MRAVRSYFESGKKKTGASLVLIASAFALNACTANIFSQLAAKSDSLLTSSPVSSTVILQVIAPVAGSYRLGQNLNFAVQFSKAVFATPGAKLNLILGGTPVVASYVSGAGTDTLQFRYTIKNSDSDEDGPVLSPSVDVSAGLILDEENTVPNLSFAAPDLSFVLIDALAPSLSALSLSASGAAAGGSTLTVSFTASDLHFGSTPIQLQMSIDGGVSFTNTGAPSANAPTKTLTLPASDLSAFFIRVIATDQNGNASARTSLPLRIASTPPSLLASELSFNSGAADTSTPYVRLALKASEPAGFITHFCLKQTSAAPALSDSCWIQASAAPLNQAPASNLQVANFPYLISYYPGNFSRYAFVKDEVGHVSQLSNSGSGTSGQDTVSIHYDPKTPPVLLNVWATQTDTGTTAPTQSDQTIPSGSGVYIKWNASASNGFGTTPVSLAYTEDDLNYIPIGTSFANGSNGGCSVDGLHTGCYFWSGGSPTSAYYRIRVLAKDSKGFTTAALSGLVNSTHFRLIAGNTYEGIGSSAASAILSPRSDNPYGFPDHGNIVVVPDGRMFIRDRKGILLIDPADGILKLVVPTTGTRSGIGGLASAASLFKPSQIAYGFQNGLLILDKDQILKLDLNTLVISSFIGGGASSADGVGPLSVNIKIIGDDASQDEWVARDPLIALPNGDVYFKSEQSSLDTPALGYRVRIYHQSTQTVTSLAPSGSRYSSATGVDLSTCSFRGLSLVFDPNTSVVDRMLFTISPRGGDCALNPGIAAIDPASGIALNVQPANIPALDPYGSVAQHTSPKGEVFLADNTRIFKFDSAANSWNRVVGDTSGIIGQCASGTPALNCQITPQGMFSDAQGNFVYLDRNLLRTVDASGNVRNVYGQSLAFGDGGAPLSARFNFIQSFGTTSSGKLIVHDELEFRMREINPAQTDIESIAGDGSSRDASSSGTAAGSFLGTNNNAGRNIVVDPATGDVYYSMARNGVERLDRSDGTWKAVASGGSTSWKSGDGLSGSSIRGDGHYFYPQAFGAGKFLMAYASYPSNDNVLKLYDSTDSFRQSHLVGVLGNSTTSPPDQMINSSTTINIPSDGVGAGVWDNSNSRWMIWDNNNKSIRTIAGNAIGTWGILGVTIRSFDYDPATDTTYFCRSDDQRLYKKVGSATAVALPWDILSVSCEGTRIRYQTSPNRLQMIYRQGSLYGLAEYLL